MLIEIRIPSPGESITEVEIASWLINEGDFVEKNQELAIIESDKATLSLNAEQSGKIHLIAETGKPVKVGSVACSIETSVDIPITIKETSDLNTSLSTSISAPASTPPHLKITPLAKKIIEENQINLDELKSTSERIGKNEIESYLTKSKNRSIIRTRMSMLRRKLSQRLVAVKNETAMLTTFNEIDMSVVMSIRKEYQEAFKTKYGIKLGFMSFFTMAVSEALKLFPAVNSSIDGEDVINHSYNDIGIAVQTDKGLMVPVIRNTELLTLPEIEIRIVETAEKARSGKISIDDLTGGTFTITNGGVFGSLLSTPILNPPQSGIFGMHNIIERPIAVNGKVEIRPMMYVALSYDHRIIDGKDSVGFLLKIKELLENPIKLTHGNLKNITDILGL